MVLGHQDQPLYLRLRNQHAVEWIAMMTWQITGHLRMDRRYIKKAEARVFACPHRAALKVELTDLPLDADFPNRDRTNGNFAFLILYRFTRDYRQAAILPLPPQEDIRIEQQTHGSGIDAERLAEFRR